jgi:processive 1,2-diacylglycerol beta-glucosyltransferase
MKILVIHASAGAGHMKAAEAIFNGLKKNASHEAVIVDALDYTSPAFKDLYRNTYSTLISKFPWLWGFVFGALDFKFIQPLERAFRRIYNKINAGKLEAFLKKEQFDYVIATHFMPTEIVSALKGKGVIHAKLFTVVTDFDVHHIWLGKNVDHYSVASSWTKEKMLELGIEEHKIHVTGIPTDEKFSELRDIGALKKKLVLKENLFTILIATGSFGIGPIEEVIKALEGFQTIVVCGHNKKLYERLTAQAYPDAKIFGLVNNMYELMAVSDVMVTKPGGLSIAEALVSQLPLIFFNPIPGQEANNIKVLSHYNLGFHSNSIDDISREVKRLSAFKDDFMTALKRTKQLSCPNAVSDIIRLVI